MWENRVNPWEGLQDDEYYVFVTTDTGKTAGQIMNRYASERRAVRSVRKFIIWGVYRFALNPMAE
jgi:hypothetical protein